MCKLKPVFGYIEKKTKWGNKAYLKRYKLLQLHPESTKSWQFPFYEKSNIWNHPHSLQLLVILKEMMTFPNS